MKKSCWGLGAGLLLMTEAVAAQGLLVTGRVTTASHTIAPQILVKVKETGRSMRTTEQGFYVLELEPGQTLQFIYEGRVIKSLVAQRAKHDVELELPTRSRAASDSTHTTGAEARDEVILSTASRGATSISGQTRPLWVLNGVVLSTSYGSLESFAGADPKQVVAGLVPGLSVENISSVRLLTSSSETSTYGPRGIAGVVEITTRSGSAGVSSLSYRGEYTYRPLPTYGELNVMNSQEHVSLIQDLIAGGMYPIHIIDTERNRGLVGRMYELFNELDASGRPRLTNDAASRRAYLQQAERRNTNWFRELYLHTIMHNHSLSFNGGTDRTNLFASLTARLDPGLTIGSSAKAYSGSISADYRLLPTLKLGLNLIGEYSTTEEPAESAVKYANTTSRTLSPDEPYVKDYVPYSIFTELQESRRNRTLGFFGLQGTATWDISKQLRATFVTDIKYTNTVTMLDNTEHSVLARSMRAMQTRYIRNNNSNLRTDPNDPYALPYSVLPEGGIRESRIQQNYLNSLKLRLDYKQRFGLHSLTAAGETELNMGHNESNTNVNYGVLFDLGYAGYFLPDALQRLYEQGREYYVIRNRRSNNLAFLGQVNYSYDGRYELAALMRYDASNRFGPSPYLRWLPTWNVELTWNATRERFFSALRPLSSLQLKGYVGLSADNPSVTNSLEEIYPNVPWRPDSRELGLSYRNVANNSLTYEKTLTLGAKLGLGLLRDRIALGLDLYRRRSYDLIGPIYTQAVGGEMSKQGNVAELQSSGLELTLTTTNVRTKRFSWRTGFSLVHKTNRITKLLSSPTVRTMIAGSGFSYEGYPLSSLFSIPFVGLTDQGLPNFTNAAGERTLANINFSSSNVDFLRYSGTIVPTEVGAMSNTFRYGQFTFAVHLNYQFGAVTRLRSISVLNDRVALPRELSQRWKRPGDEAYTDIPRVPTSYAFDQYGEDNLSNAYFAYDNSTARVVRTDFVRLKELSLEYSFARQMLRRTPLKTLSLRLQAQNLALLYSDAQLRGDDPEYMYSNSVTAPKKVILTLRIGL